jgi:hypothetical protein
MNSRTDPNFWRLYRLLPVSIRKAARAAYRRFLSNPQHPGLQFHRLTHDPRLWSVRVTKSYRAVALRQGNTITWFWIGDHDEFDRLFPP